jgi:hypothetical protein
VTINVISGIFTIVGGLLTWFVVKQSIILQELKIKRRQLEKENLEIIRRTQSASILKGIEFVEILNGMMRSVFMYTKIDRVLILTVDPNARVLSVVYEEHRDNSVSVRSFYNKQKVDNEYLKLLRKLEMSGQLCLTTKEIPDSFLKTSYENENISAAALHFIGQIDIGEEEVVVMYISFAVHNPDLIDDDDQSYITAHFRSIRTIFRSYLIK